MRSISLARPEKLPVVSSLYGGAQNRARIADALRRPLLLSALQIGQFGQLLVHTTDWANYWRPVEVLRRPELDERLAQLRGAWEKYVASGFEWDLIQPYCFGYFTLLEALTSSPDLDKDSRYRRALSTVVAFENFGIIGPKTVYTAPSAATSTARNPVYLLARLKWPTVPHSTRFLPLIAVANSPGFELFGHYRRSSVSDTEDLSVMVYPKNVRGGDIDSLAAIGSFIAAIGSSSDPFVNDRAGRLWEHIVQPLVMQFKRAGQLSGVEIADIGSSTGSVVGKIAANLVDSTGETSAPRLRITLIDSAPSLLSPEFSEPSLRARLDDVQQVTSDYREWLVDVPSRQSQSDELRLAFACKVFDMASDFDIRAFRDVELPTPPSGPEWFDPESRLVTRALATSPYSGLLISSQRFATDDGHLFAQPSLSTYFGALQRVSATHSTVQKELLLPVRVFDPSTLVTSSGESAVEAVLRGYDFLVIEDADLRPADMLQHLRAACTDQIGALDLTASMRLSGNYAYLLWRTRDHAPDLEGERLL